LTTLVAETPRHVRRNRNDGRVMRTVVTIALLSVLATAIVLVLLQSAGVISWGFLGPTS
jgi:hypothetical protein